MKITYLHQYFNTPEMAGGTRSYEMARRLVAMGHEVDMVTSWRENDGRKGWFVTNESGIRVHWLPVPYGNEMGYRDRIAAFLKFAVGSARKAASLPADVVYATSTPLTIAIPGAWVKWRHRVPMVFEVRDLWPDVPRDMGILRNRGLFRIGLMLEQFAYKKASHIVALTDSMRDFITGKGVSFRKVSVIPNFANLVDSSISGSVNKPQDRYSLIYCGSLGPAHGPRYLVELAEAIYEAGYPIAIKVIGQGGLKAEIEETAKNKGLLGLTIIFAGERSKSAAQTEYGAADASLMTLCDVPLLYRHSVQNKFFDSIAAGKPVFANYRGWASEVAESAGAGFILDRYNTREAAESLMQRLSDDSGLETAHKKARALAEARFDPDILAKKLEGILLEVAR